MEDVITWYSQSDRVMLELLGQYLQQTRLNQNRTQEQVSEAAGINRSTLIQFEQGKGGTMLSFIQILRALEQLEQLRIFEIKKELSPLQLAALEKKQRFRARKRNTKNNPPPSTW